MQTGHAKTLALSMDGDMPLKNVKIDLKNLNILCGTNGSGKSLIMKIQWVMCMIAQCVVAKAPNLEEAAQYIFDNSIPDHQIMGMTVLEFETGAVLQVNILGGKVNSVTYTGFEKIDEPQACIYMSSSMRLFTDMKTYLGMRKLVGNIEKMNEHYKLYDILYVEQLIKRMPLKLTEQQKETLAAYEMGGLESIELLNDDFIGTFDDRTKKSLSLLGNGNQAIINMFIGSGL